MKKLFLFLLTSTLLQAQCYEQIGLGGVHVTALKPDGTLWGWGDSQGGQLGNTYPQNANPLQISTDTDWDKLFVSYANRTFAIKSNGTLWGIGSNSSGILGVNSTTTYYTSFQQIGTASNWLKVDSGSQATLALRTDGTLWGWGRTDAYQLAGGLCCGNQLAPIQLGTDTDWVDAQIDSGTGIALKSNGTIWGWGFNGGTKLLGQFSNYENYAIQLNTHTDWVKFSLGGSHLLALKTDGSLWGWGSNTYKQLTDTYGNNSWFPVQIGTDTNWDKVLAVGRSSFAIKTDGTLWGWGLNDEGQIGLGYTSATVTQPTQIGTATDWVAVYGGGCNSNCAYYYAIKTDGTIWAWGSNNWCQYGDGTGNVLWGGPPANTYTVPTQLTMHCVQPTLNTSSFEKENITVYPNPVNNLLQVNVLEKVNYKLFTLLGTQVKIGILTSQENTITTENLAAGVYLLQLTNENGNVNQLKIIKE